MSHGLIDSHVLNSCWYPPSGSDYNRWHKLSVQTSNLKKVDVLVDEIFVGSLTSYMETRGYGGPFLFAESNSLIEFARWNFRNFHIIG